MRRRQIAVLAGAVAAGLVAVGGVQVLVASPAAEAKGLVPFEKCDALLAYYRAELRTQATPFGFAGSGGGSATAWTSAVDDVRASTAQTLSVKSTDALAATDGSAAEAVGSGSTGTNLQESGVDEPDVAKLSDGRIVLVAHRRLQILSAGADPRVLGSVPVARSDDPTGGIELFVAGDRIVVITPFYEGGSFDADTEESPTVQTRIGLYSVTGGQPALLEESVMQGSYVSARLTEGTVRIITAFTPEPPSVYPTAGTERARTAALAANRLAAEELTLADVLPQVVRSDAAGTVLSRRDAVTCDDVAHSQAPRGANSLVVTTMRPAEGLAAVDSDAIIAGGDLVYAAADRLYVATSRWSQQEFATVDLAAAVSDSTTAQTLVPPKDDDVTTEIHAFDTSAPDATTYVASGSVPGFVLGRWAFSRYGDALRVATTTQPRWTASAGRGVQRSMLLKLAERDGSLVETGRVDGLGKTEQIKSVRYFGDVAAVVTFRQTDPLYLVDLSGRPRVRGELKITGYSSYLHPLGDGKLLGLGMEADARGTTEGMQASVFDIGDLDAPTLVDRLDLGYAYSSAMEDSRAFTYDPARRIAMFHEATDDYDPVTGVARSGVVAIHVSTAGDLAKVGSVGLDSALDGTGTDEAVRVLTDSTHAYAINGLEVAAVDAGTFTRTGDTRLDR